MASQGILMLFFSFLCCHGLKSTEVPGDQFGKGVIRTSDIELREVSTFTRIWSPGLLPAGGATFYSPSSLPPASSPRIPRPTTQSQSIAPPRPHRPRHFPFVLPFPRRPRRLHPPLLHQLLSLSPLLASTSSSRLHPRRPPHHLLPAKALLSAIRCVRDDLLDPCQAGGGQIWSTTSSGHQFTVHLPDSLGTFLARAAPGGGGALPMACFKTNALTLAATMPNLTQITAMIQTHAPWFHFHPDEPYLPSSVSWFFNNGALLYTNATPNSHVRIDPDGDILPQGGANDGTYWLDLPVDPSSQQFVKAGNLSSAKAYIHVKPVTSIASTDIVFWLFYPFNGAGKAKVEFVNIGLGRLGEHVGDWEHVTQRFSNFDGELKQMYFSQHSSGSWVDAADLEYDAGGSRPAAYATLHGHAFYPKAGLVLKGEVQKGVGLMDLTAKGGPAMDAADGADVVSAEYLGVEEPPWLQYMREWGPKLTYDEAKELERAMRFLPGN
ncbi:hypothetical protein KSP40_PGU001979 [Platanthera guangdongensis]|uniref:Uncharacterized protein n=1 Tax=Platanthera guangdongensis TaxID=2320717 RepID=A0ABR2LW78_9ASPA